MAANVRTEMRMQPTRVAPKPPPSSQQASSSNNDWGSSNELADIFGASTRIQAPQQKKKPPPRPPPPKFPPARSNLEKPKKPARPTELLTNLFGRRTVKSQHYYQQQQQQHNQYKSTTASSYSSAPTSSRDTCLIDLSPPGSPSFTGSDGLSVDSFGSDGNSNPSAFISSSGSTSAFEDDFDFFGSLSTKRINNSQDPWKVSCSHDPFGSIDNTKNTQQWIPSHQEIKEVGESNFFAFNSTSSNSSNSPFDCQQPKVPPPAAPAKPFVMPTIIMPVRKKGSANSSSSNSSKTSPVYGASKVNYSGAPRQDPLRNADGKCFWDDDKFKIKWDNDKSNSVVAWDNDPMKTSWGDSDVSPPMPKLPPPPPPPEYIAGLEDGLVENSERPYGIALYDFPASQPGDLEMREGDVVYLTKLINDNWMEGRVGNREGMFPVNFIDVKIPLPGLEVNVVNALYAFKGETSDDLLFEEGARIKVLARISDEWLYGEWNGKQGQFPANFVDKVPSDLPNRAWSL
ncbi:uncharacterized protein B0303.7 isoform X2 [Phymastichus coffea]|uniref:uncharacterized protein B0303.7 isoform X2 n=1 Tax=Phymastichus coffea TaxID=108790 RepID=UPI00273BF080|nr:uncharacterized protein B0303.7 isoform X2 [Phymastichus coffea]